MENKFKRFLSLLLALVMVIGMMPMGHAHAAVTVDEATNTINMQVGDSHTFELDGDYSGGSYDGGAVANISATFTPQLTEYTVANTTTDATLETGKYVLQNTRVNKFLESTSEGGKLWLAAKLITTAETWTITKVDGGYTMKASNGQYLTFDNSNSGLTDTVTVLSFTWKDTSTWQIGLGNQYLNSYDSEQKVAGYFADGDGGSQWRLYKVTDRQQAYSWTLGSAATQIKDGGYYIFENNAASSRAANLVSSKWSNTTNGGAAGDGLLMENNKTNFGKQNIWKITGTEGNYHVQDRHGWNLYIASGKATLTPESHTTVIGQNSTSHAGKWQISVGGVHLNWWGGAYGDGVQTAGYSDENDTNSQWNIYEVIPTPAGTTTVTIAAVGAGDTTVTIGDTTYSIHVTATHEHNYVGTVTQEATCTTPGVMTYECSCGENPYTAEIPTIAHTYEGVVTTAPTLNTAGTMTYTCSACGDDYTEEIAMLTVKNAQVLSDSTVLALANCEYVLSGDAENGYTLCHGGNYYVMPKGNRSSAKIPQGTTNYGTLTIAAYTADNTFVTIFGRNGVDQGYLYFHNDAENPDWNRNSTVAAQCAIALFKADEDSTNAAIPGYTQVAAADMKSGDSYLIAAKHNDGSWYIMVPTDSTATLAHVAKIVDAEVTHTHDYTSVETTPATCTTPGVMTKTCTGCGHVHTEVIPVDENAHTPGADATCGVPQTCTACGVELTPATGEHVYDNACDAECNVCSATREVADHVYDNACDTTCNVCNAVREVADHVYDNACDAECNVCSATREVGDHSYESKVTPPTFETAGYTTYTCSVCGHTYTADEVPAKVAVAQVGETKYATFEEALAAAKAGEVKVVTLLNEKGITITADTTYDLSGVTVESEGDVFVVTGGTLTLNGNGEVKAGTSGVGSWTAVWANGGNVVINGGTYSVGGDSDATDTTHQNDVIYTKAGGTVTINGGTFLNNGTVWTLNENDSNRGTITVYGGSFQNWDPANNVSEGAGTSFLADGYVSELKDGYYVVTEAPEISGTLSRCYANEDADGSRITGEITGLYATESVEIKLYSGDTLISTTKLVKTSYLPSGSNGTLTVKIEMSDDSSSWDTTWVEGHPRSDYQPDKAVLYLDGQQMNTVPVNMWHNDYKEGDEGYSWVWAELTGVAKVVAKVGETNYLTLADAVEAANAGDTVTLLGNATGAGVVIDKNITIDLGTYTYTINSAVGSAGTETNGFQIKSGNDVTIKNGTLAATTVTEGKAIKMLVQNYANLTLEDVTLDGTGSAAMQYVLSNNSGEVEITGKTNITAPDGAVAFDVYDYSSAGYDVPTVNVSTTGTISGKIEVSKTATLNISSGTYTVALDEAWCAEGFVPVKNANGTYGVTPALPTATVTPVENEELTFALNFKADEVTEAQLEKYSAWYADFVLTVNKEVTFNANGGADGYLSGQYDAWSANWVNVPFEDVTLNAGESLKIMEYAAELMNKAGLKLTYNDVYNSVKDFDCGVFFTPEFLAANSDLVVTLELRMYNNEDENESYAIGETYEFTAPTVVAKVGDKGYATLAEAVAAANAGETVTLLANTNGDGIKINKNITIDLNEKTYTINGTLVGSAKTQSNGFQILKGNEVTIKNGAIVMDDAAKRGHDGNTGPNFVIQNYANLTLKDVNITGNNETTYVVSINSGEVAITGDTSITVKKDDAVAFDVYKSSSYDAPVVNVSTTGTISGKIEVTGGELALNAGIIDGALVYESGTVTKAEAVTLDAPENYEWVAQDDGTYLLTEEVVEPELFDLVGANMTLGNSLDINFFVDPADVEGITDAYAVITKKFADGRENVVVTANQSTWKTYQGLYYFSLSDISAKELADQIEVVVYNADGEAISNVWYDSGREYGMRLIKQQEEAETPNAEHLTFAVDMLNYGAAAQNSFEYNTDDLANNKLTTAQQAYATQSVTITNSQVKDNLCAGATLLLQNRIQLNFIYKTTDITEGMYAVATYTNHRGVEQSVNIAYDEFGKVNSTYTYIPVVGAAVADCRADITLTLYSADGTVVSTTVDSVESYCARIATSSSDPLYTMIMKLCDSAYALFH